MFFLAFECMFPRLIIIFPKVKPKFFNSSEKRPIYPCAKVSIPKPVYPMDEFPIFVPVTPKV